MEIEVQSKYYFSSDSQFFATLTSDNRIKVQHKNQRFILSYTLIFVIRYAMWELKRFMTINSMTNPQLYILVLHMEK